MNFGTLTPYDESYVYAQQFISLDATTPGFHTETFTLALQSVNSSTSTPLPDYTFTVLDDVACFRQGTLLKTPKGLTAVENLAVGDMVCTSVSGLSSIAWIGYRHVDCRHHPKPEQVWPVRVSTDAFGCGLPCRDLWLSPDHAVLLNDVLIPIKHLINGTTIVQVPMDEVTYYHIELPQHDVLLAEGLPAESYLDVGDHTNFENGGQVMRLFPDFATPALDIATVWEAKGCAPLIVHGPELEAVRAFVNARAKVAAAA